MNSRCIWTAAEITLLTKVKGHGSVMTFNQGRVHGPIGYFHRGESHNHTFLLVHLRSSYPVCEVNTEKDAIALCEFLATKFHTEFSEERDTTIKLLPIWVKGWIHKCQHELKYIDPAQWETYTAHTSDTHPDNSTSQEGVRDVSSPQEAPEAGKRKVMTPPPRKPITFGGTK